MGGVESRFWGILRSNCLGAHRDLALGEVRNSQSGPFRNPRSLLEGSLGLPLKFGRPAVSKHAFLEHITRHWLLCGFRSVVVITFA